MKKQILLIFILGFGFTNLNAQFKQKNNDTHKKMYIGLGGAYTNFQDIKYSAVQYSGMGATFEFGYNHTSDKAFWEVALNMNLANEKASTYSTGKAFVLNPNINFKYLRSLNNQFFIGGRIDLADFYFRKVEGLGNNGVYYINGHHLYGSLIYKRKINNNWNLQSSLDIAVLSFMKESTSFGFSAPQNGLENGEFNYQNEKLEDPFGYKYFQVKHLANNLNIRTSFVFSYKKRISIGYFWNIRHFSNVKSYPVTTGMHNIIIRYNIINK